ncbi:MAG: hypothetical protein K0U16_07660 [Gammaproteobacteria bacterium]|nr:hypothetical protein [Gammaproteobacteria bacterium]
MNADERKCWEIIRDALAAGFRVELKRHDDRAGPRGVPEDPRFPWVYTASFRLATGKLMRLHNGRHGLLLKALEQADKDRLEFERDE